MGVLPSSRRQGLGAAVTALLAGDALDRGVDTVFLSASDDAVARIYARIGFRAIGTADDRRARSRLERVLQIAGEPGLAAIAPVPRGPCP